ncbi:O-antigen ligase family protein [Roseivirga sp.]|uniref:O-antigen ligase family protein n=1 Tax=Roseivirga sp. TaxID=1964215 RepID=UPI003B51C134
MILVAAILLILYIAFFGYTIHQVIRGNLQSVFLYAVTFFPVYALFLTSNFDAFGSPLIIKLIQYSKEVIIFSAFGLWIFGQRRLLDKTWDISGLDKIFLAFIGLAILFFALGLGEATVTNRAIYLKNIFLIGIFYCFGRNVNISFREWNKVVKVIFITTILACVLVTFEKAIGTHFHTIAGYAKYNTFFTGEEPQGSYGLAWTFEAEGGRPRYGAFFAHPLELAASMLVVASIGVIYLVSVPYRSNKFKYLGFLFCAFICLLFAYSRASFASFFLLLGFMALMLRYYKLIGVALSISVIIGIYIVFFAANDILYFVVDTLTFQNSSSLTHIVDWLNAVNSIISNPMGIGLAMSGNAGGVEKDLIVGGENQYLIYGVQMGVIGMLLYIGMLYYGIRNSWRAFRLSPSRRDGVIPFVAASVKFGMLLPLFTANAEAYIYVSLISWWLIGHAETLYQKFRRSVREEGMSTGRLEMSR